MRWAMDNRRQSCLCSVEDGLPACKGDDPTPPNYLFLGIKGGHPRRSNYADDSLTPAAEGRHPAWRGTRRPVYITADPWPGIPVRHGNRRNKAADLADGTWPDLTGKFAPHDYRRTHATWLDSSGVSKVLQMDRRGHALQGMDRAYVHVTVAMRQHLCEVLEQLWLDALAERYKISSRLAVPLLNGLLRDHETGSASDLDTQTDNH